MIDLIELAKVIGENMPKPYAMDDAWRPTNDGSEFDLTRDEGTRDQWVEMAAAAFAYVLKAGKAKLDSDGNIVPL